jgi:hypothetical protein
MQAAAHHHAQQIAAMNPGVDVAALQVQIMSQIELMHSQIARFGLPPLPTLPPSLHSYDAHFAAMSAGFPGFPGAPKQQLQQQFAQRVFSPGPFPGPPSSFGTSVGSYPRASPGLVGQNFGYDRISPMPMGDMELLDPQGLFLGMVGMDEGLHGGGYKGLPWALDGSGSMQGGPSVDANPSTGASMMSLGGMMAAMAGNSGGHFLKSHAPSAAEVNELSHFLASGVPDLGFQGLEHDPAHFSGVGHGAML